LQGCGKVENIVYNRLHRKNLDIVRAASKLFWLGVATVIIIAILWAVGGAVAIMLWPGCAKALGLAGWGVAVFAGCRIVQGKAHALRRPLLVERVALAALLAAVAGEGLRRLLFVADDFQWWRVGLRLLVWVCAVTLATKGGVKGHEAYRQCAHHFGKTLLEERE
jgi:hypothetical protein